jgi:hypothetical protein
MSDEIEWAPPAAPTSGMPVAPPAPPAFVAPSSAAPPVAAPPVAAPAFAAPAFAAPPPPAPGAWTQPLGGGAPTGWTPPPKPGLIPLRPLDLGTLLGASFRVMRRNPRPTLGAALAIEGASVIILMAVIGWATWFAISRINSSGSSNTATIEAGGYALIIVAALVPGLLVVAASALLQGVVAYEVSRGTLGEKPRFRQHWQHAKGRLMALIGWTFLLSAMLSVGIVVLVVVITLAVVIATVGQQIAVGITFGIVLSLGLVVLFAWLLTKMSLVPSIIMIERASVGAAVSRSWFLTRTSFWRVFGILLLVNAIISAISQVITFPLTFIAPLVIGLIAPNDPSASGAPIFLIVFGIVSTVVSVIAGSILSVIQTSAVTLIYVDLRMRREGLDLELARFVEGRNSGATELRDPYLVHSMTGVPASGVPASPYFVPAPPTQPMPPTDSSPWG